MARKSLCLFDLPNEILVYILTAFPTHSLLPLTLISTRFHSIILRILHYRLLLAASAPEYKIILEAYQPSRRYTRPFLYCTYLGTDGLSSQHEGEGSLYEDCEGVAGRLGRLGSLFSRFRPEYPGLAGTMPMRRIAGATPVLAQVNNGTGALPGDGWSTSTGPTTPIYANGGDGGARKITHSLTLDSDEWFTQFCAYGSLSRLGPRPGVFLGMVNIVESGAGTIRIFRDWLLERADELLQSERSEAVHDLTPSYTARCPVFTNDQSILWTDFKKNVGLRMTVKETGPAAGRAAADKEDLPLSFELEIQELVVRTSHLMLAVEKLTTAMDNKQTGKALIFGNFVTAA